MSLLEKAKDIKTSIRGNFPLTKEDEELVRAYYNQEINIGQVQKAKGFKSQSYVYCYIVRVTKQYWNTI